MRRPAARALGAVVALSSLGGALFAIVPRAGASTVVTDRHKIAEIEAKLAADGDRAQALVAKENDAKARLTTLRREIASESAKVTSDKAVVDSDTKHVRQWAIDAYVNALAGTSSATATIFGSTASGSRMTEVQTYLGVTSGTLDTAVAQLQQDVSHTDAAEHVLQTDQSATMTTINQLTSATNAAEQAVSADDALLGSLNENLLAAVSAAALRAKQQQEAQEEAQLAASAQTSTAVTPNQPAPVIHVTPGKYADPFRNARGLTPERIDQGVDYMGFGAINAIGDGVVLSTYCGGWPGGTFIAYRLTDGPAAGLVVYAAEDIQPTVSVGQSVTANTVISQMYEGSTGIETGWADPSADGMTLAADNQQFDGGNSTAYGTNFSALLSSLGAPGGQMEGGPSGSLPAAWPNW